MPRVRLFACGQALSEEVAFSSRQRTTGSRLHGFPFVHDDHHQGQSLLILFCLFLPFVVLGCFLSQPFRIRSAVSLRAEIQVAFPGLPPLLRVALGSTHSVSALPGLLRAHAGFSERFKPMLVLVRDSVSIMLVLLRFCFHFVDG